MGLIVKILLFPIILMIGLVIVYRPDIQPGAIGGYRLILAGALKNVVDEVVVPALVKVQGKSKIEVYNSIVNSKIFNSRPDDIEVTETWIAGVESNIFTPKTWTPDDPTVFFFHGGMFTGGSISVGVHSRFSRLAELLSARVIAPDYRLASEAKFSASYDDCYGVVVQALQDSRTYKVNHNNYVLMGESSGAQIAIAVSFQIALDAMPPPLLVAPINPLTGSHLNDFSKSQELHRKNPFLKATDIVEANLALLQYDTDDSELREVLLNNMASDEAWRERYMGYMDYFLDQQFDHSKVSNNVPELSRPQKDLKSDYSKYMRDFRSSCVKMDDTYLTKYLNFGPAQHLYVISEHDIARDEGLIMAKRLQHLQQNPDETWREFADTTEIITSKHIEIMEVAAAPHHLFSLSTYFGGLVPEFDQYVNNWTTKVRQILQVSKSDKAGAAGDHGEL